MKFHESILKSSNYRAKNENFTKTTNRNSSPNSTNQDSDIRPCDFGSHGNHMIMTSLETMTNTITSSNVSKISHNYVTNSVRKRKMSLRYSLKTSKHNLTRWQNTLENQKYHFNRADYTW